MLILAIPDAALPRIGEPICKSTVLRQQAYCFTRLMRIIDPRCIRPSRRGTDVDVARHARVSLQSMRACSMAQSGVSHRSLISPPYKVCSSARAQKRLQPRSFTCPWAAGARRLDHRNPHVTPSKAT